MKINEIIKALRCTGMPRHKYDCENCPYRDGKKYWEDCDVEKIAIDAADLLEKIQRNMESDINFLKRKEEEAEENAKEETDLGLKGYYTGRADAFYTAHILAAKPQEKINAALKEREQE